MNVLMQGRRDKNYKAWAAIIGYSLMWPIIGITIAVPIVIYILIGWESFKQSEPVPFPIPYESWRIP